MDLDGSGYLSIDEFKSALAGFGMDLLERELLTIMRLYDPSGDGRVDYNEFCRAFGETYTPDDDEVNPISAEELAAYKSRVDAVVLSAREERSLNALLEELRGGVLSGTSHDNRDAFRRFDSNRDQVSSKV